MVLPVLVALPEPYLELVSKIIVEASYQEFKASTIESASEIIQTKKLLAVILTTSWIFAEGSNIDLISLTKGKIPTVTLIEPETTRKYGQKKVYDKVYTEELQEFCTMPFTIEELLGRMNKVIRKANQKGMY